MVPRYYKTFNDGSDALVTAGFEPMWAYLVGPMLGGFLGGIWKQYDGRIELSRIEPDYNPWVVYKYQKDGSEASTNDEQPTELDLMPN